MAPGQPCLMRRGADSWDFDIPAGEHIDLDDPLSTAPRSPTAIDPAFAARLARFRVTEAEQTDAVAPRLP